MNFYAAQDNAKKKTKYLVLIYLVVLVVLTFLSTLVLILLLPMFTGKSLGPEFWQTLFTEKNLPTLLGVGAFVIGGALISSYVKSRHLSKGGSVIAASLGGNKIQPNTSDLNERKVLNVVEEMAIASGMPVPEVYLLRNESAINAFAAGQTPMDAVIGVTQGCIDKLTRTQLQGVIGHEFSHILNGDMRLNLRIIMLLHGIEFIGMLGRIMTSSQRRSSSFSSSRSRNSKGNGAIVLAGIALRIIGWFGVLFGNMIQAAVSRQREFLADASSVQFTRDPSAIGGALKVIGGISEHSRLKNTDVNEAAHIFFGQAFRTRLAFLFATHPPVELRIRQVEPGWDGEFLRPLPPPERQTEESETESRSSFSVPGLPEPLAALMAAGVLIDQLSKSHQEQLEVLVKKAEDPMEAMALVLAVLLYDTVDNDIAIEKWQQIFKQAGFTGLDDMVTQQLLSLKAIELANQLPLIELTMPALKELSEPQYVNFKKLLQEAMLLDGEKSIFEQSVFQLVTRFLDVHFGISKATKVRYRKAKQVRMELQVVFSMLTYYGHKDESRSSLAMNEAFKRAMAHLGLDDLQRIEMDDSLQKMSKGASERLVYCSQMLKQRIVEALVMCVEHDGKVNELEKELILALAATMDAPIPRLSL